jgi:hypothetical protein
MRYDADQTYRNVTVLGCVRARRTIRAQAERVTPIASLTEVVGHVPTQALAGSQAGRNVSTMRRLCMKTICYQARSAFE